MELRPDPRAPDVWLAEHEGCVLVFGLDWAALLGRDIPRLARRRARLMQATHYVWAGSAHASVGAARLGRLPGRRLPLRCAALAAARALGMESGAVLLGTEQDRYWLMAVHAGAVISQTDRLHGSRDAALQALAELSLRYPGLPLYGNAGLDGMRPVDWDHLFTGVHGGPTLHRLRGAAAGTAWLLPPVALAALAWVFIDRTPPPVPPVPPVDPRHAWEQSLDQRLSAVYWHRPSDLAPVFASLRKLPLAVKGWRLRDAHCSAQGPDWLCQARYARGPLGRNRHLADVLPPGWQLRVELLDGADLSWRLAGSPARLSWSSLGSRHDTDIGLASRLQDSLRLFVSVRIQPWRNLPLDAPLDAAGKALAWPSGWRAPGMREIELDGPLHAYALLESLGVSASWQRLQLQVASPSGAGLASHRALVRLQGLIYETH